MPTLTDWQADPMCQLFDPSKNGDLQATIELLSKTNPAVYGIGFSLGACMLINYVSRNADLIPGAYRGTLAWSGAFRNDFITLDRYMSQH